MLKYNLGENTSDLSWPSDALYIQRQQQTSLSDFVTNWTKLNFNLKLEDTTFKTYSPVTGSNPESQLFAQFSFFNSHLNLLTFSHGSLKFELHTSSFLLEDIRSNGDVPTNQKAFCFKNILKPLDVKRQSVPQLQINFNVNKSNKTMCCIFSNLELICNLEWLLMFQAVLNVQPSFVPEVIAVSKCDLFATNRVFSNLFTSRGLFAGLGSLVGKQVQLNPVYNKSSSSTAVSGSDTKATAAAFANKQREEFKVTLNETQIVLLEDVTVKDSPAIVVKCSAFCYFTPHSENEVAKLNIREMELLSCIYHAVQDTTLSIIEPLQIDIDVVCLDKGLASVSSSKACQVDLTVSAIVTRLSHQDIVLLLAMLQSYRVAFVTATDRSFANESSQMYSEKLLLLENRGYPRDKCQAALKKFDGDATKASEWIIENSLDHSSDDEKNLDAAAAKGSSYHKLDIVLVNVSLESLSLFLIDDTKSVDLPLLHLNVTKCVGKLNQKVSECAFEIHLHVNSFNPNLSGWESFVEQWPFQLSITTEGVTKRKKILKIHSDNVLDIAVSPFTFELVSHLNKILQSGFTRCRNTLTARQLFMPYVIENKLGLPLTFSASETSIFASKLSKANESLKWKSLPNESSLQFDFSGKSQRRNVTLKPHLEKVLHLQVNGYAKILPLCVNEVGTYLRTTLSSNPAIKVPERILVHVGFSKELLKRVITVTSGVEVKNLLDISISVAFENETPMKRVFSVKSGQTLNVPLNLVYHQMYVKPDVPEAQMYPRRFIDWNAVKTPGSTTNIEVACFLTDHKIFRYNACIHSKALLKSPATNIEVAQPSHSIKICPTLVVQNLLPVPFTLDVSNDNDSTSTLPITLNVEKESTRNIHVLDLGETLKFVVRIEGFKHNHPLIIDSDAVGNGLSLLVKLFDTQDRPLSLEARICSTVSGGLKIGIYAAYWLINKTGLPLVFKQVECDWEIAGQTEDNEIGTCSTPIMMSFAAGSLRSLKVRCGRKPSASAWRQPLRWSSDKIYCDYFKPGHGLVTLDRARNEESSPHYRNVSVNHDVVSIYSLSYEVFAGKDDYVSTSFIVLRPTYMLYNYTKIELLIKQAGADTEDSTSVGYYKILPGSCTSFQWSADDVSGLLSVRLGDTDYGRDGGVWSGGFCLSGSASVDIYLRTKGRNQQNVIIHVDIVEKNSQHLVYFRDNQLPPQYIIENKSLVDLQMIQFGCPTDKKQDFTTLVPPKSSLPFCLDFPLSHARLNCNVYQSRPVLIDLDKENEETFMTYETFSIFAFVPVQKSQSTATRVRCPVNLTSDTLVFDVSSVTNQVILQQRSISRNDQIWRIMSNGMIRNEGRSKSFDYDNASDGVVIKGSYVLDIIVQRRSASLLTSQEVAVVSSINSSANTDNLHVLCLRPAEKKKPSQIWRVDSEGRLINEYYGKLVFPEKVNSSQSILILRSLNTQNNYSSWKLHKFQLKPGCGRLVARMQFKGPTRVLVVEEDIFSSSVDPSSNTNLAASVEQTTTSLPKKKFLSQINILLSEGISLSVMNSMPEELIYVSLRNIMATYLLPTDVKCSKVEVRASYLQVDNQLLNSLRNQTVVFRPIFEPETRHTQNEPPVFFDLKLRFEQNTKYENCQIIHKFRLTIRPSMLMIVERLLLKLIQFVEQAFWCQKSIVLWRPCDFIDANAPVPAQTKLFIEEFVISKFSLILTAHTNRNLTSDLQNLKSTYKITLFSFDGAKVSFRTFHSQEIMLSSDMFIQDLTNFYKQALQKQAISILGHVDFLGNPVGLLKDVNSGVRQIENSADSVSHFARFVTNSVSKSTSKIAESLSDGIGSWIFDEEDQEQRELFRENYSNGVASNMCGGVLGLVKGVTDGIKGIATQPYRGFRDGGVTGGIAGVMRGVTGAIAKPSIGVLDFAYFTANAMKYTTSTGSEKIERLRSPRCCTYSKLITPYNEIMSKNQEFLYQINNYDISEKLIALEIVNPEIMKQILITNTRVLVIQKPSAEENLIEFQLMVDNLVGCNVVSRVGNEPCCSLVIESALASDNFLFPEREKTRRVDCKTMEVAAKLKMLIEYAISKNKKDTFTFK